MGVAPELSTTFALTCALTCALTGRSSYACGSSDRRAHDDRASLGFRLGRCRRNPCRISMRDPAEMEHIHFAPRVDWRLDKHVFCGTIEGAVFLSNPALSVIVKRLCRPLPNGRLGVLRRRWLVRSRYAVWRYLAGAAAVFANFARHSAALTGLLQASYIFTIC